jgi:hypothetical protein
MLRHASWRASGITVAAQRAGHGGLQVRGLGQALLRRLSNRETVACRIVRWNDFYF